MKPFIRRLAGLASCLAFAVGARAAVSIDPYYADSYSLTQLGSAPGVPANYGGLTIELGDPSALLLGGTANSPNAKIYSIPVQRDAGDHITGFGGSATIFADAYGGTVNNFTGGIDGGLAYGPGGVLFYTSYFDNHIGQIELGSTGPDRLVNLTPLGVSRSVGGLTFVPKGMPGEGRLKIVSTFANRWYDATVTPDGAGTYNITRNTGVSINIGGSPEGIVYVPPGSPLFPAASVLVAEYGFGRISAYEVNANGDPIMNTQRTFISGFVGLDGPEGAAIDPLTGDFLFSSYGGNQILRVTVVPEPGTWVLLALGVAIVIAVVRPAKTADFQRRRRGGDFRPRALTSCSGSGSAV